MTTTLSWGMRNQNVTCDYLAESRWSDMDEQEERWQLSSPQLYYTSVSVTSSSLTTVSPLLSRQISAAYAATEEVDANVNADVEANKGDVDMKIRLIMAKLKEQSRALPCTKFPGIICTTEAEEEEECRKREKCKISNKCRTRDINESVAT
ncbi:hypothetical protein EGR_10776 [Echinococcus granulosus]|uniref:Uncharacterized protein n=1 Tax=Echinococcus granulosus TaxID=6210 RepID=W6U1G7_ECHGR|nr:hypothetical protein EGR_10776 [Echinococcus granulosus]EUB54366.1 hypothetical protein EGR_10776 [Echinococcus granulosus]